MSGRLPNKNLLSVSQAADIVGVSVDTLRRLDQKGKFNPRRGRGDKRFYTANDVDLIKQLLNKPGQTKTYSLKETARILQISPDTLRRWENKGRIKSLRTSGGHRRFTLQAVEASKGKKYQTEPIPSIFTFKSIPKLTEADLKPALLPTRAPKPSRFNLSLIAFVLVSVLLLGLIPFALSINAKIVKLSSSVRQTPTSDLLGQVLGVQTQGGSIVTLAQVLDSNFNLSLSGYVEGDKLKSVTTTSSPLDVQNTTRVDNLNADLLDGKDWDDLGTLIPTTPPDSLDFSEFKDAMSLDANTDIALGGLTLSTSGAGAMDFNSTGQVSFAGNVNAEAGLDVTGASLTVGGSYSWTTGGVITAATDETLNGIDVNSGVVSDVSSIALSTGGNNWDSSGNLTISGDLAVNGDDISADGTTFNINVANGGTINFRDGTNNLVAVKDQGAYAFLNVSGKSTTGDPAACSEGDLYYNATDDTVKVCHSGNSWEALDGAGSAAFTDITSGTNTTAAMVVGTGASLTYSGTGTITASDLTCIDCLNFTEISDTLVLDGATDIALGALTLSTSGTGAMDFNSTGQVSFAGNVNAEAGLDVTTADLTVAAVFSVDVTTGDITTSGDAHINGGNIDSTGALAVASATTNALTLDSGTTGDVNVGTGANAKAITIGNSTTTTTVNLTKGATGNIVLTGFNCTSPGYTNGGALTTDASGNIACSDDDTGAGSTIWSDLDDPTASLTLDHTSTGQYTTTMDWTATGALSPWTFSLVNNAGAGSTQNFVTIRNDVTAQTNDVNTESLLLLDNADTSGTGSTVVDAAILITNSGAITNGITTAVDASAAQIVNAINVGSNIILGTAATIDFAEFDVSPTTGSVTIDDDGNLGSLTVEGTVLDIDSLTFTGAGTVTTGAATALTLDSGTTGAIDIGTSANAKAITIGNSTTTTTVNLTKGATGNIVLTGYNCTSPGFTSGGVLTTDASGNVTCDDDDSGGAATSVPWSGLTDPTTFLTLAFDNGEDNTFSYVHSTGDHSAWTFNYSQTDDLVATDDFDAMTFNLSSESGDAGDTFDGIVINWANGTANTILDSAIKIDNAEGTAATLTDAIIITSSGAANGVTDAIDVSAANLNNAINVGANFVLFDGLRAFEGTTGTLTIEDTGNNDMALFVDQGSTGSLEITDSLQVGASAPLAYSRFGTTATSHSGAGNVDAASDVVINDDLEVDGTLWLDGGVIHNAAGTLTIQLTGTPTTTANELTASSWKVTNNANLGWAALIVDQTMGTDGTTDVFAASASGSTVFRVNRDGGTFIIAGGTPPSTLLTVGAGSGKIDVGTVDPVYNIGGTKYATYMAGMVGVKEETAGNVFTQEYVPGFGYRQLIDFKTLEPGSDLWLFSKATALQNNFGKMVILLTPSVNTKTWYSLDKQNYTLSIYTLRPTSVSYRLTAPRFDSALWTNYNNNPGAEGFQIPDEEISLNPTGEVTPDPIPTFGDYSLSPTASGYELKDKLGQVVEEFGAFGSFIAANIKAGAIETASLSADAMSSATATVDNMIIKAGLVAPSVQTEKIAPLGDKADVRVQVGNASESGFGKLIVQNPQNQEVASIDSQGNASFSGELKSDKLQVANEATISGTLYADNINSTTLDGIQTLLKQVEADQQVLAGATSAPVATASDSATLTDLYVLNQAAINSLSIGSSIAVGTDMVIQSGAVNTISSPLSLQSLAAAPVEIMAGKVRIETNGNVTIDGNLNVAGAVSSQSLTVKQNGDSGFGKLISVVNAQGAEVASIDASGSASFKDISVGKVSGTSDVREAVDIAPGAASVSVSKAWSSAPSSVVVTPTYNTSAWVTDISQNGFTINVGTPPDSQQKLYWWAVW